MSLSALLADRARALGEKPFLFHAESAWSYRELDRRADAAAARLRGLGARPGDVVMAVLPNGLEFFEALFGAARLGATFMPADPSLKEPELAALAAHARPRVSIRPGRWEAAPGGRAEPGEPPLLLLYTSGTTGEPKGVALSGAAVEAKLAAVAERFGLTEKDTTLCLLPVCFGHALIANVLPALRYGGAAVLRPAFGPASAAELWPEIERRGVTTFSAVPSVLRALLSLRGRGEGRTRPRFVTCASAPLPPPLAAEFEAAFGAPVLNCYGLTETASWIAAESLEDRGKGTVGRALGCELDVRAGGVLVRGPSLMAGYFRRPDLTAKALAGGWLDTGDVGELDAEGRLTLRGRTKEIIIRAGLNVYPDDVDAVLLRHPAVLEAATVGAPDPLLGEKVVSFVALKPGASATPAELAAHCRGLLADWKCPASIRLVPALPRDARGKIRKRDLAA